MRSNLYKLAALFMAFVENCWDFLFCGISAVKLDFFKFVDFIYPSYVPFFTAKLCFQPNFKNFLCLIFLQPVSGHGQNIGIIMHTAMLG